MTSSKYVFRNQEEYPIGCFERGAEDFVQIFAGEVAPDDPA